MHYTDIAIFVSEHFTLTHPVHQRWTSVAW